ncbi:UPF0481 protein At3g47200-like [Rhodamnia argentea]|uniref:UPF0481 protein At3g47200-like n=1 Tax=Rhodamnia argentea TaxID=178133 RepID=A0A8B8PJA5_9MYRT|nr:UPF0481 protein At3g47200-like [Rhodamnia argentea]
MAGTGPTPTSDHHPDELVTSITNRLKQLSAASADCSIYTVPDKLRRGNEEAYTPRVVAIGPYHRDNKSLKPMEDQKLRYLQSFLQYNGRCGLEDYIKRIKSREDQVRKCYNKPIVLDSDEFAQMMLLDGIFAIQLFLMQWNYKWRPSRDPIFGKPWMINDVRRDMWLLENQIPFFAVQELFEMAYGSHQKHTPGLLELAYGFLRPAIKIEKPPEGLLESEVKHFLDAIRLSYLPSVRKAPYESHEEFKFIPSATELAAAGVKLTRGKSQCLLDIKFKNGALEIPCLRLYHSTESYFRNIIAFEQCYYRDDSYLIDYMAFMDHLINTPGDAKLLIGEGIIENWLGNEDAATRLLNAFCNDTYMWTRNAYFHDLRHELVAHCRRPWNEWKATFKRKHCSSPLAVLSVTAGVVLLLLTIAQTVCSFLSLK